MPFFDPFRHISRPVFLAAILLVTACDSAEERLAEHYARGVELAEEGEPRKAILEFRNALKIDETHVPSLYGIAEALEATGELQGAFSHLVRVIEVDPNHVPSLVKLSQAMLLGGNQEKALEHAETAYSLEPENPDVLAARAAVKLRLGETTEALENANTALALAPDHPNAGMILIAERMAAGDAWEAMALIDRFLESNPENLPLNLARLQLLEQDESRRGEAIAQLERMIELYPEERGFRQALAQFHQREGNTAEAIEVMREIAALDPENSETALQLARFILGTQGEDAAREELAARIKAASDGAAAFPYHRALAELDIAAGDSDAAKARFDQLIADEGLAEARIARARLHLGDAERDPARALVDAVLDKDARNVDALALRATLEIDEDDPDAAVLTLRQALAEEPERVDLLRLSAIAHERTGDAQLAAENLAAAVRASNHAPEAVLAYVQFLRQRDRNEAAASVLDEALRRHPEDRSLLTAAAELRLALGDWAETERLASRLAALGDDEAGVLADRVTAAARSGQGRLGETIEILESISEDTDGSAAAMSQLVRSYVQAEETDKAVTLVEETLADDPENPTALMLRGALHQIAGEAEQAEARYEDAIAAAPEAPAPRLALMRFHAAQGERERARQVLEEGIAAVPAPANHQLRLTLAGMQEIAGDFAGAIETYRALYEERPGSLVVANNLASLLSDHRADDPESVELAVNVARRLGDSPVPQFQDTYGWTLYLRGDYGAALAPLRKAVEGLPDNPWVQYHLGQTYAALGEDAKAREHLSKAAELGGEDFPKAAEIEETLASLKPPAPSPEEPQAN